MVACWGNKTVYENIEWSGRVVSVLKALNIPLEGKM
jgi:hypothetical protein